MKDVAAESAIIRNADTLSRGHSHITVRALLDAARSELQAERSDSELLQTVDRLIDRGFLRESTQFEGYLKTDLTDRQIDAFAKAVTDPTPTNPRVSASGLLDANKDRSNPMDQAQRYSIVDASVRGGVQASLDQILSPSDRENTVFLHGERGPDIARFPVGTENLQNMRDFLRVTRRELATQTAQAAGYGPQTTLVVSDAALRSGHRAEILARTAEQMQAGKVIIMVEPDKSSGPELAAISHAIRAGAVSELGAPDTFTQSADTLSLQSTLTNAQNRFETPRGEGLEIAAARRGAELSDTSDSPAQLVASDPLRLANLNKAAQVIQDARNSVAGEAERPGVRVDTFSVLAPSEYNAATGSGIRQLDVIQIRSAPEGSGYQSGERFAVNDVNSIDSKALVKNSAGNYVRLPLETMARDNITFDVLTKSETLVREGDPVSIQTAGGDRITGQAQDIQADTFDLALRDGRSVALTTQSAKTSDLQPAFATSSPDLAKPGAMIAVSGVHDRSETGGFNPGASALAARQVERDPDASISIFTTDSDKLATNSARTEHGLAMSLQQIFERSLGDEAGPALPDPARGDEGR